MVSANVRRKKKASRSLNTQVKQVDRENTNMFAIFVAQKSEEICSSHPVCELNL